MKAEATDAMYHVWLKRKEGQTLWTLIKYLETRLHIFDTRYSTLILNIEYWRTLWTLIKYLETRLHIYDTRYSTLILNIEYWRTLWIRDIVH